MNKSFGPTPEHPNRVLAGVISQIGLVGLGQPRTEQAILTIDVVVGGQFGSEAKGHVTQKIIRRALRDNSEPVLNIRVAGPNAGHTTYAKIQGIHDLQPFAFRQLPVGIVENADNVLCAIAAGSEIDLPVLLDEIKRVQDAGLWPLNRVLVVDPEATLLLPQDHAEESAQGMQDRIGSTGKGIGAARASRIMRRPDRRLADNPEAIRALSEAGALVRSVALLYSRPAADAYRVGYHVVIEGTQGYGLGLHAGAYPQTTSSDCRAIDFLAMAGISPWCVHMPSSDLKVWVVVRPFPIRVAGNSGPLKDETSWEALGLPEERTTVTKKVRRVGGWDADLARAAVAANGGGFHHTSNQVVLALTMADQIDTKVEGAITQAQLFDSPSVADFIESVQSQTGAVVDLVTTSPSTAVWLS